MMSRRRGSGWTVGSLVVAAGLTVAGDVPTVDAASSAVGDRVASVPDGDVLTSGDVVAAKVGLGRFITEHVDRPLRVAAPCPTIDAAAAGWWLNSIGLALTTRDFGVAVAWESDVGGGLVAVRCGVDLNRSSDPPESVRWSTDVTMLDGQATFAQLAVAIGGRDVDVAAVDVAGLPVETAGRCTNGGRDCTVAVAVDDLAVILRLEGMPVDNGESLTRGLAVDVIPEIVRNLAAVPAP